jgi:hypothetical protein
VAELSRCKNQKISQCEVRELAVGGHRNSSQQNLSAAELTLSALQKEAVDRRREINGRIMTHTHAPK